MSVQYWIVKSPFKHHSWSEILFTGKFQLFGIRNFQSRNNIREMRVGDKALFFSSSNDRKMFGVMEVSSEPFQDPSTSDNRWLACDFKPIESFHNPIPLKKLREFSELVNSSFFKQPRVSVVKISERVFMKIIDCGNISNQDRLYLIGLQNHL